MTHANIGSTVIPDLSYNMTQIGNGNISNTNKPNLSYMIQSSTGNTVIDQSVNTISEFAQRVNDELQKKSEPVILTVEQGEDGNYTSFNTSDNCAKISSAINTSNPNIYVKWYYNNASFMSPVSINTTFGEIFVTVWGYPFAFYGDDINDNSIIGVQYWASNIVDKNHLFNSYRIIRSNMDNWIDFQTQ